MDSRRDRHLGPCGVLRDAVAGTGPGSRVGLGRPPVADLGKTFTGVRSECGDVYEPDDVREVTGLGDHRPAIGMTNEQDRTVDLLDHLLRAPGVVRQGRQGILHSMERVVTPPGGADAAR